MGKLPISWFYHSLIVLILVVACWLRVQDINQFPPGVSNDEAVNVVDIFHISTTGNFPIYQDFGRPEPLYRIILSTGAFFFGSYTVIDRYMSALIGIVTLATLYWAVLQALQDVPPHSRYIAAIVATVALAIALGHITLSRALYRGILQPLFMCACFGFTMRGLRSNHWRDFLFAGINLALTVYSYTSALLVPFAFLPLALSLLLFRLGKIRQWLPRLFVIAIVSMVLVTPILYRFVTQPTSIIGRANAVSGKTIDWQFTVEGMFTQLFTLGDENPQYNVANAPVIPTAVQALFMLGILGMVLRIRHPATLYVATLMLLCSIPAIASDELSHGLRIVGWFAVFPLVISFGVASLLALVERFRLFRPIWFMLLGVLISIFMLKESQTASTTYQNYWLQADQSPLWFVYDVELNHSEWFFRTDKRALVEWIEQQAVPLLVPVQELNYPTTRAWLTSRYTMVNSVTNPSAIPANTKILMPYSLEEKGLMGSAAQFALLENHTITILPPITPQFYATLLNATQDAKQAEMLQSTGNMRVLGYTLPFNTPLEFATFNATQPVIFGQELRLNGWYGNNTLSPNGASLQVALQWESLKARLGHEYFSYLQVQTQDYQKIVGKDQQILRWLYPTTLWSQATPVPELYALDIPALDFGAYRLVTGVYPIFGTPLPTTDTNGNTIGDSATVGWLKVPLNDTVKPHPSVTRMDATINQQFRLESAQLERVEGNVYKLSLFWQSLTDRPTEDATIFVHVTDANGQLIAQSDTRPYNGQYPTFIWGENEKIHTEHLLTIEQTSLDTLSLSVGMYTFPEVVNLPTEQNGELQTVINLGDVQGLLVNE